MAPLERLSPSNFFAVCDVAMDIREKLQMVIDNTVVIPVMRTIIRGQFSILLPAKSVELVDNYCELRLTAINYIKSQGCIKETILLRSHQRWSDNIKIIVDKDAFNKFYDQLIKVYEVRVVEPNKKQKQQEQGVVSGLEQSPLPVISYNSITGMGMTNTKKFKFKDPKPEYRLFKLLFEGLNKKVYRYDVLVAICFYEDGEDQDPARHGAETEKINDVVKKIREKTGLTRTQLVINGGNLTLLGSKQ